MYTVTIQINQPNLYWEDTHKTEHVFNTWEDVSTFAYRLAWHVDREVRVEYCGNGTYYAVSNAQNYLRNSAVKRIRNK